MYLKVPTGKLNESSGKARFSYNKNVKAVCWISWTAELISADLKVS